VQWLIWATERLIRRGTSRPTSSSPPSLPHLAPCLAPSAATHTLVPAMRLAAFLGLCCALLATLVVAQPQPRAPPLLQNRRVVPFGSDSPTNLQRDRGTPLQPKVADEGSSNYVRALPLPLSRCAAGWTSPFPGPRRSMVDRRGRHRVTPVARAGGFRLSGTPLDERRTASRPPGLCRVVADLLQAPRSATRRTRMRSRAFRCRSCAPADLRRLYPSCWRDWR